MAEKHVANAESAWTAICVAPDCCKVGKDVVPFDSVRNLSTYMVASPNVYARGTKVYPTGMGKIQGVDSDAGGGLVSLSALGSGRVDIMADSTTVCVNGSPAARHDTPVLMNVGPGGPNTVGKLDTSQGAAGSPVNDKKLPCNDPPKTSKTLEDLQAIKDKLKSIDPSQLDEYVRFGDASKGLDGLIAKIDIQNQGGLSAAGNYGAQASRAVLGFGKDIVLGLGNLLYTAAKHASPAGMIHDQIDVQTLAEHIRLGNICLESVKQAAKAAGHELAKPVTDAWDKGNYVEAVTRGGLEVASLLLMVGDLAKLGQGAKAAEAAKAAQTARAAEAARAAEVAKATEMAKPAKVKASAGTTPKTTGVLVKKKPYANKKNRPKYADGQVDAVWEKARRESPDGKVRDPNTGEELSWDKNKSRAGQWDMGHMPGQEYRNLHDRYMKGEISLQEFLSEYRNPANYQPESLNANRGHKYEGP